MSDKPKTDSTEISIEELITGIGKLVYKLNESIVNIDGRIEKLETGISTLLQEKFEGVTAELVQSNEHLIGLCKIMEAEPDQSTDENGLIEKLDELKLEITGIREDLGDSQEKYLNALAEGPEDAVGKELFSKELSELSQMVTGSASSLQKTVTEVIDNSDEKRVAVISENLTHLSDGIGEISAKMDDANDILQQKLGEIQTSTAQEVASISISVQERTDAQIKQLEEMKDLLSLHSVEVKDNRVKNLNRSAIGHFNNAEFGQALTELEEALELSPDSSGLLANLAHIKASQGKLDEAEEHFRKALEINPELEPAVSGLGTVLVITGRAGDTIDFLQKYLDEGSEASPGIMIALSRAYISQGNHAKALEILETAEKAFPGHTELEQELAKYRD